MPFIDVRFLPKTSKAKLVDLQKRLQQTVASMQKLQLRPEQVTVGFLPDMLPGRLGKEIIIKMDCILDKPDRTQGLIHAVAENVKNTICYFAMENWPQCELIEVFAQVFGNPQKCAFVEWRKE